MAAQQNIQTSAIKKVPNPFQIEIRGLDKLFRTPAAVFAQMTAISLDAMSKSADLSADWTRRELRRVASLSMAATQPSAYVRTLTEISAETMPARAGHFSAYVEIVRTAHVEAISVIMDVAKQQSDETETVSKRANPATRLAVDGQMPDETPEETPVEAPDVTPVETPVETPAEAPVEAPVETPVEAPVEVPAQDPPAIRSMTRATFTRRKSAMVSAGKAAPAKRATKTTSKPRSDAVAPKIKASVDKSSCSPVSRPTPMPSSAPTAAAKATEKGVAKPAQKLAATTTPQSVENSTRSEAPIMKPAASQTSVGATTTAAQKAVQAETARFDVAQIGMHSAVAAKPLAAPASDSKHAPNTVSNTELNTGPKTALGSAPVSETSVVPAQPVSKPQPSADPNAAQFSDGKPSPSLAKPATSGVASPAAGKDLLTTSEKSSKPQT